ncbi:MAG: hypothetical protein ACYDC8_06865 [Gammaproteobacteria bacterium]
MNRFIGAIKESLRNQNWYSALYISLTLPDICARIESDDGKTSGDKFVAWFDRYLGPKYQHAIGPDKTMHIFLNGNDCYALRCAVLHEGGSDITTQNRREVLEKMHFTVGHGHCNQINSILQLDVPTFCTDVCDSVSKWELDFRANFPKKTDRFDTLLQVHIGPHQIAPGIVMG